MLQHMAYSLSFSFCIFLFLATALKNHLHYEAYQHALKEGVAIPLKYLKVLFFGPPRTGKTSMRRRLVREIKNLTNEPIQASTGTAEVYDVIVKPVEDKTTTSKSLITKSEWSNVKALFGKEKGSHETDLDEELQLLCQFIYEVVFLTENKSPPSPVNRPESKKSRSPVPTEKEDKVTQQSPTREKTDTASDRSYKADPNASISTPQVSQKQMEEVEKTSETFNKILHTGGEEQLKVLLEGTILMNMVDTGGHPAFLEMLPALTMGPALYLIFFRLNQELQKRYLIQYVSKDNVEIQLGESSYTVEEVIFQALSSIACFGCTVPKKANMPNLSHAAMLIGTHMDLLGSDPKAEIKGKDYDLQKEISVGDLFKAGQKFLRYASKDQLMFAVDNMNGDEEELKKVHERLENIMKNDFDNFSIPASWLMFSIFLRKMEKRTLSLSQCHEIGKKLEMKVRDTDEALWFLHHCVGTLMHFPGVKEMKDIVVCDPQMIFDSVTDLILNSFTFEHVGKLASENFKTTGQFSLEDVQRITKNSKSDNLPPLKLLKLLEHLNIIAPIKPECHNSNSQSGAHNEVFFMPAVLKHATDKELHMEQSPTDPVPLMIHFKCGFVPVGVFCAMIANLVTQKDTLRWILQEPKDGHNLCKNKVTFRINGTYNITLISKPKWYEIHIARFLTTNRALEEICQQVLETICETLNQVITKMKYQSLYELGFKCPKHWNDDHLVINRPRSAAPMVEVLPESAITCWLKYPKNGSIMICPLEGETAIDLRDTKLSPSYNAQQNLVWFGKVSPDSIGQFQILYYPVS